MLLQRMVMALRIVGLMSHSNVTNAFFVRAIADARTKLDGSSVCFNFMCMPSVATR
jgi:hypothetical protein